MDADRRPVRARFFPKPYPTDQIIDALHQMTGDPA